MKSKFIKGMLLFSLLSGSAMAEEDRFQWGLSLMTDKTDSNDEYNVKGVVFAEYDGFVYDVKKDKEIKEDIETCKNILSDLEQLIIVRKKEDAENQKWWDDRKKFTNDWMSLIDKLNDKLIEK